MQDRAYRPLLLKELGEVLGVSKKGRKEFNKIVHNMLEEGLIVKIRGERYGLPARMNLVTGILQGHADGYGFLISDTKGEPDVFIPRRYMTGAMNNDKVVARIEAVKEDGRIEGRVIRVLERFYKKVVGRFEKGRNFGFVIPSDKKVCYDIFIAQRSFNKAKDGDIVVANIISYPQSARNPEGEIIKVLGQQTARGIDTDMIIEEYGLPSEFPKEVLAEAMNVPEAITDAMLKGRVDHRNLKTVTIDGERARDFDDAVSIEKRPDGCVMLWVHIADVSHYVPWGTALDKEAYSRGTSVYFPDKVIPMFPERLSNGICSLNPQEDRLTLTAEMLFDKAGNRINYRIYESVINSNERMTYTSVKKILEDQDQELIERYGELLDTFQLMKELCLRLRKKRIKRGSIDFDLPEPEIVLDIQSKAVDIVLAERNIAHQIIEEFMLSANETVAVHVGSKPVPFIYRVHETPDEEKIMVFNEFIDSLGYKARLDHTQPKTFQRMLDKLKGKPEEVLINRLLLRSMKQARYSTENIGHFGLASEHYTHFTSPIRRYPDLIVHRMIKESEKLMKHSRTKDNENSPPLFKGGRGGVFNKFEDRLIDIAKHSSERERLAMDAEREVVELKKLEYMQDKAGTEYTGVISGVTAYGFYVELDDILVEGLVRVTSMYDDFYRRDEKAHRLVGDRLGKTFRLGDKVKVKVDKVDMEKKKIDFKLVI
ncbi:MAG: ribonuclease R [Nitrospirae bacterium]|nr:ribonuclease R [Nitrospirota bacterium]